MAKPIETAPEGPSAPPVVLAEKESQPAMASSVAKTPTIPTEVATAPAAPSAIVPAAPVTPPPASAQPPAKVNTPAQPAGSSVVNESPPATASADADAAPSLAAVVPTFDVVRVERSGDAVVAGLAEPEAKVEVLDGPAPVAVAEANDRGEWAMALDAPLPPGTHDLAIRTTSKSGRMTILSDQRVAVSVPADKSDDTLVVLNAPDMPSTILQLPRPEERIESEPAPAEASPPAATGDGAAEGPKASEQLAQSPNPPAAQGEIADAAREPEQLPAKIEPQPVVPETQPQASASQVAIAEPPPPEAQSQPAPLAEPATQHRVVVAAVEADPSGGLYVAGTADTPEPVRVYIDNQPIGEAAPSPSGTWLVETKREMPAGTYTVRADQVDPATGAVIARAEVPFEREVEVATLKPSVTAGPDADELAAEDAPKLETVIIKRGDNLWRIARDLYGRGVRYSTIYQANRDQIRNPHWIYPGQVFVVPAGESTWQQ
jgi:nucleoid-associated protein YgaU